MDCYSQIHSSAHQNINSIHTEDLFFFSGDPVAKSVLGTYVYIQKIYTKYAFAFRCYNWVNIFNASSYIFFNLGIWRSLAFLNVLFSSMCHVFFKFFNTERQQFSVLFFENSVNKLETKRKPKYSVKLFSEVIAFLLCIVWCFQSLFYRLDFPTACLLFRAMWVNIFWKFYKILNKA